jgi:hypothetical protein
VKIEDIYSEWAKDGEIDQVNISTTASDIPKLHNKYYRFYVEEGLKLKKQRADYKVLIKLKNDYYRGDMDSEELKEHGWDPQPLRILKSDIPTYIDADKDVVEASLKIGVQEAKVEYLESIIRQINNRNFILKSIIDWERFRTGA